MDVNPNDLAKVKAALAPWVEKYVRTMDDAIKVPGTNVGVGLDPIIGFLLPGAGDAITGVGSIALLVLALREGVPTVAILRMVGNILVDTGLGALPIVGDAFDLFFRSNRRNLEIVEAHRSGEKPKLRDYVVVAFGITLAIGSIILPMLIFYGAAAGIGVALWKLLSGG